MNAIRLLRRFGSVVENVPKSLVDLQHRHFLNLKTAFILSQRDEYILSLEVPRGPTETEDVTAINENIEIVIDPEMEVKQFVELCKSKVEARSNVDPWYQ